MPRSGKNKSKPSMLATRYEMLLKPGATIDSDSGSDDDEEGGGAKLKYAAFLREKERKVGPDGFVDSTKHRNKYVVGGDKKEKKKESGDGSGSGGSKGRISAVDMAAKKEKDQRDYEKRIKLIEDHMWQHKQEERELKRTEGDIMKNQRALRKEMRDFENAVTRKRLAEEKKLNQGLEKYTHLRQEYGHQKENVMKHRTEQNVQSDVAHKDQGRKVQLTTSDLARQYRSKMELVEQRKHEQQVLADEYQAKLRRKEEEQFKLKQEVAELAIALNMEAQKGRTVEADYSRDRKKERVSRIQEDRENEATLENKLAKGDNETKAAELNRRKLSADLTLTRAHLSLKKREEGRHKQDTENRLRSNVYEQKSLNDAALHAELDLKSRKIDQKIVEVNQRRTVMATKQHKERRERDTAHEATFSQKFQRRHADQERKEHEDHVRHFQKIVQKGEEQEFSLYNQVKTAEYARQQQEQKVKKMASKLHDIRRTNAAKIKDEMTQLTREEREMEYKLQREQAELAKAHANREERYLALQHHRTFLTQDKHLLDEHSQEQERLVRISTKTNQLTATSYS